MVISELAFYKISKGLKSVSLENCQKRENFAKILAKLGVQKLTHNVWQWLLSRAYSSDSQVFEGKAIFEKMCTTARQRAKKLA